MKRFNKINITKIVNESVNKVLREWNDEYYFMSGVFDDKTLKNLEKIMQLLFRIHLDVDRGESGSNLKVTNWDEYVEGLNHLREASDAYVQFKKMNLSTLFAQYGWDRWEELTELIYNKYDYDLEDDDIVDSYLNYANIWDKYMPTPEEVNSLIGSFKQWFTWYMDYEAQEAMREIIEEKEYCLRLLK